MSLHNLFYIIHETNKTLSDYYKSIKEQMTTNGLNTRILGGRIITESSTGEKHSIYYDYRRNELLTSINCGFTPTLNGLNNALKLLDTSIVLESNMLFAEKLTTHDLSTDKVQVNIHDNSISPNDITEYFKEVE